MDVALDAAHATDEPSDKRLSNRNGNAEIARNDDLFVFFLPNKRCILLLLILLTLLDKSSSN